MVDEQYIKNKGSQKGAIWLGEDNIIHVKVSEKPSEKEVVDLFNKIEDILKTNHKKFKILIDASIISVIRSSGFRKRTAERIRDIANKYGFEKTAIFAENIIIRTIASFIVLASGLDNIKVFANKEEAKKWLTRS